jgi:hypothetical protein
LSRDTGFPNKGRHSGGVRASIAGFGRQGNCQVAVRIALGSDQGSVPLAWRLYLPQDWLDDAQRRRNAGVSEDVHFTTKPQIALEQLRTLPMWLASPTRTHISEQLDFRVSAKHSRSRAKPARDRWAARGSCDELTAASSPSSRA